MRPRTRGAHLRAGWRATHLGRAGRGGRAGLVVAGHVEEGHPSFVAGLVADELPPGRLVDALDHLGPFTDPGAAAEIIRAEIDEETDGPSPS